MGPLVIEDCADWPVAMVSYPDLVVEYPILCVLVVLALGVNSDAVDLQVLSYLPAGDGGGGGGKERRRRRS